MERIVNEWSVLGRGTVQWSGNLQTAQLMHSAFHELKTKKQWKSMQGHAMVDCYRGIISDLIHYINYIKVWVVFWKVTWNHIKIILITEKALFSEQIRLLRINFCDPWSRQLSTQDHHSNIPTRSRCGERKISNFELASLNVNIKVIVILSRQTKYI